MRIGVFGGTFDPPHNGHYKYACEAMEKLELDRLIVIPASIPPHKANLGISSGEDRMKMTELLFCENENVFVSDMELGRQGKSYTVDTVRILRETYPEDEIFFLMGSDMLLSFHTWYCPMEIIGYVRICAVTRCDEVDKEELEAYISEHFCGCEDRFTVCDFEPVELSSTQVRNAVKNGKSISSMVKPQVEAYIIEKELYL